jgi:hypothetical protein
MPALGQRLVQVALLAGGHVPAAEDPLQLDVAQPAGPLGGGDQPGGHPEVVDQQFIGAGVRDRVGRHDGPPGVQPGLVGEERVFAAGGVEAAPEQGTLQDCHDFDPTPVRYR